MAHVAPYTVLADCYDAVMEHVDYPGWVDYIEEVLAYHGHEPGHVLELACGTGTFAALFSENSGTASYVAVDGSEDMIRIARSRHGDTGIDFGVAPFSSLDSIAGPEDGFDTILLLYDGLNYLMEGQEVADLLEDVAVRLRPGGMFIFDQSTPANSINNEDFFEDTGEGPGYRYVRRSAYDRETRVHTTSFEIATDRGLFEEVHYQRCYSGPEIQRLLSASPLEIDAGYGGFSLEAADTGSERIHWVVHRP